MIQSDALQNAADRFVYASPELCHTAALTGSEICPRCHQTLETLGAPKLRNSAVQYGMN